MLNKVTLFVEGEGGVGKTSVLKELLSYGWDVAPEVPILFPDHSWCHLLKETDQHSQIRGQQHFLHLEAKRYSTAIKTNAFRLAFDRSFFSTLAYSHAIEEYWCNNVYENTISFLFDMLECRLLEIPNFLVLLEAPLLVRQQRCLRRDSGMTASAHDMADSELHKSDVFAGALTHFYSALPNRIDHVLPLVRIKTEDVTIQEIARLIHRTTTEIECTSPKISFVSLFDALSNPSTWDKSANQNTYGERLNREGDS
jgi:hypothetical protein